MKSFIIEKCMDCSCDIICTSFQGFLSSQQLPAVCVSVWRQFKCERKDALVAPEEGQGETWLTAAPSGCRGLHQLGPAAGLVSSHLASL